jgi:hypothetical protein
MYAQKFRMEVKKLVPNSLRPDLATQAWIVRAINVIGYNPFMDIPIHLWGVDQISQLRDLYREVTNGGVMYEDMYGVQERAATG